MFKTLASFLKPKKAKEGAEEETEETNTTEQNTENTEDESQDENAEGEGNADESEGSAEATISTERYNALLAAERELSTFGATAEARANLISEMNQLYAWYENVKKVSVAAPKLDANAEKKGKVKVVDSVTAEAKALEAKRAGK